MPASYIFGGIVLIFMFVLISGMIIITELGRTSRLNNRLRLAVSGPDNFIEANDKPEGSPVLAAVSALGMLIARSGLLSRKTLVEMTATLEAAGFRGGRGLGVFIGSKILLFFLVPALLYFGLAHFGTSTFWVIVKIFGGATIGLLLPETIATNIRKRHLKKVETGIADALDMLVICADAGLALEAGLVRVAQELTQTSKELQIGADMRRAMDSLGQRTGLDPLKRLATTLAQSLQYGTPLTQALRTLSAELRQEALIKFEERAGRLPTLMTIPMILFILPCVFLIVAGPAIINVLATLKGMK